MIFNKFEIQKKLNESSSYRLFRNDSKSIRRNFANKHLLLPGDSVEFKFKEAKGYSPIAEALFDFPFVAGVFITANFVTWLKRIMFLGILLQWNCVNLLNVYLKGKKF